MVGTVGDRVYLLVPLLSDQGNAIEAGRPGLIVGGRGDSAIVSLDPGIGETVEAAPGDYRVRPGGPGFRVVPRPAPR